MIGRSQTVLQAARTAASACWVEMAAANHPARQLSSGPTTATPPADASRGATADLCDVFLPDPVDVITESKVSIVAPLFRFGPVPPVPSCMTRIDPHHHVSLARSMQGHLSSLCRGSCRDYGGNMRFSGQAATVKCFENNPLVRKVWYLSHQSPGLDMITSEHSSCLCKRVSRASTLTPDMTCDKAEMAGGTQTA